MLCVDFHMIYNILYIIQFITQLLDEMIVLLLFDEILTTIATDIKKMYFLL